MPYKDIKVICLDVDGTLTNGQIYISNDGAESKSFNVKDGMAIAQAIKKEFLVVIITGRTSKIVDIRAKELGIIEIHQGIHKKLETLLQILDKYNYSLENVAYIGDDINDLILVDKVKFFACPKDACNEVTEKSQFVSAKNGGEGAVREVIELILKENNYWESIINNYVGVNQ